MEETKLTGKSKDIILDNISILKELFPEIVVEDKIDFDTLKKILGESIDDSKEKYTFSWPGKTQAIKESQKLSTGTLRPYKDESKNWESTKNLYIEGDNLEVLKLLQKSYYNKIKAIYIDPPYNTGKDFIYNDNYEDTIENYLKLTGQINDDSEEIRKLSTNVESNGRYHSNWLNMMYPRLKLARNLLTNDGIIFISIDDNEINNLKKICDEIFGEYNFISQLPRLTKKGGKSTGSIARNHDYVLIYTKSKDNSDIKGIKHYDEGFSNKDEYFEERGYYKLNQTLDYNSLQYNKTMDYPIEVYGKTFYPGGSSEEYEKRQNGIHKRIDWVWRWSPAKFKFGYENGFIVIKNTRNGSRIYTKTYLNASIGKNNDGYYVKKQERTKPLSSISLVDNLYSNDRSVKELKDLLGDSYFEYVKPTNLIKLLLQISTEDEDIIMDFFSGSSTVADSIMQLNLEDKSNRHFIMVQLPEKTEENSEAYKSGYETICEIGKERIRRAGNKVIEESGNKKLDIGFKVFKLDSSNLKKWEPDYYNIQQSLIEDEIKPDRTSDDLVYEVMLKYGVNLTYPIEQDENIYSVGFGALVICLEDNVTKDIADKILKFTNKSSISRVVFKDSGFKTDADKTNIKEILKTNGISEFITI